jgi:molybdopterin-guanine dinucleotide biosynthesis protein A
MTAEALDGIDGIERFDGIVLAGGRGSRLGGADKASIVVGGRRLLDVAVDALGHAKQIVVVGTPRPIAVQVRWSHEHPLGGGPVAAIAAALPILVSDAVVILAGDLPFVDRAAVERLVRERRGAAAVIAIDANGRDQPLLGCYDVAALRAALPASPAGASMRSLTAAIEAAGRCRRISFDGRPSPTWDCDTPADLATARELT